jgi:DNA-binding MarR family transcriptional regulator
MNFDEADELNEAIRTIGLRHRALAIGALAPLGIHPGHKILLLELESEGPRTQAQLAGASGYEPPTITMSVRQLEAAAYVLRRPSPTDGRATIVELTGKGRALLPRLKTAWHAVAEQTVAGLASTPFEQLTDVLVDLAGSLAATDAPSGDVPRFSSRSHTDETRPKQSKGSPKRPFAG